MQRLLNAILTLIALFGFTSFADAALLSISTHRDIFMQGHAPDQHLGSNAGLVAGVQSSSGDFPVRSLVGFDVSALNGEYETIDSITLTLYGLSHSGADNKTVQVYEVSSSNADWTEGITGPATVGLSTWNNKHHPSTVWTGGGGLGTNPGVGYGRFDTPFSTTPLAFQQFLSADAGTFPGTPVQFIFSGDLTGLMDRWMTQAGGVNASVLLRVLNEGISGTQLIAFQSRQGTNPNFTPTLTINYSPIPEPTSMCLIGLGAIGLTVLRRSIKRQALV